MKLWIGRHFWLLSLFIAFLLFWLFGDVIIFLTVFAVVAFFFGLKGIFKVSFFYLEIIVFGAYLLFAFIALLFIGAESVKVLVIILGIWFIGSFFVNGRIN